MLLKTFDMELHDNRPCLVTESITTYPGCEVLNQPEKIVDLACEAFGLDQKAEEHFLVIAMNSKCRPLGIFPISKGTASYAVITPREVFIRLLLNGATSFVALHNHPSGDSSPSKEDEKCTKRLKKAAKLIGICFLDHIIVPAKEHMEGCQGYFSFKEAGML